MARLRDTTEEQMDQLTDLQFKGTFFFLQVFAEQLAATGGGSIVTMSSASVYALLLQPCRLHRHESRSGCARAMLRQ